LITLSDLRANKFYDPTIKSIFEIKNKTFFEDIEFGGRNKIRDIIFEEESVLVPTTAYDSVQTSIPINVQEADIESHQDIVKQLPTQVEIIVSKEQTQQHQEHMPLKRSTREKRNAIPDD